MEPRSFNQLCVLDKTVVKTSELLSIHGELFFYMHIPEDIVDLFPKLLPAPDALDSTFISHCSRLSSDDDSLEVGSLHLVEDEEQKNRSQKPGWACLDFRERTKDGEKVSIFMRLVEGPTFSHLLTNRCLTHKRLHVLLQSLHRLHQSSGNLQECKCSKGSAKICDNYSRKVNERLRRYKSIYAALKTTLTEEHFSRLDGLLRGYEEEKRGLHVRVVHGDPVLTNILQTTDGRVKFIDMRGMHGAQSTACLSMEGDAVYDLAKLWQSLSGYDFISRDRPLLPRDIEILLSLQSKFRDFVKLHYPRIVFRDIVLIAARLYTSLVPLHDEIDHQHKFAQRASFLARRVFESSQKEADFPADVNLMQELDLRLR